MRVIQLMLLILMSFWAMAAVPIEDLPDWKRYLWSDLALIMEPGEKSVYLSLESRDELDEWQRRFWLRRDPTPTTNLNERREVHELRLAQARHSFSSKNFEGFDLRGRDLILFGNPDERIIHDDWFDETGYHNMRESWVWVDLGMRAEYEDRNLDGEYELAMDDLPSSRPDVNERFSKMFAEEGNDARYFLRELKLSNPQVYQDLVHKMAEGDISNFSELQNEAMTAELLAPKLARMKGNYLDTVRKGKDTYQHEFHAEALWTIFAIDNFREPGGMTRVELSHEVRARDLRFTWDFESQIFRAKLLRRVVYYDEFDRPISQSEEIIPIEAENLDQTRAATLLPGLSIHRLEPGNYRMALRLEDLGNGRLQIFTTSVEVMVFPAGQLILSDITFASLIDDMNHAGPFNKGDWWVKPHPLHGYGQDGIIQFFFEIYGLELDEQGLSDYAVSYRIRRKNPETRSRWLWTQEETVSNEVSATFLDRHGEAVARHPLSVSAAGFVEDAYELEIEVTDRLNGKRAHRLASFSILPARSLR
jgi:GWxTD domain-containing protein